MAVSHAFRSSAKGILLLVWPPYNSIIQILVTVVVGRVYEMKYDSCLIAK